MLNTNCYIWIESGIIYNICEVIDLREKYLPVMLDALKTAGINFAAGLPDSWLRNVIEAVEKDPQFKYVPVCNEGVGFSICAGAWLGGKKPVLFMESSGLRVATEAIARLNFHAGGGGGNHGIGTLIVTSYRGDMGDTEFWSIPHAITLEPLLKTLRIPYFIVRDPKNLKKCVIRAARAAFRFITPTAIVVSGDLVMVD
jgi:sulfopyruvate decarboxylase subunit alpha